MSSWPTSNIYSQQSQTDRLRRASHLFWFRLEGLGLIFGSQLIRAYLEVTRRNLINNIGLVVIRRNYKEHYLVLG